MMMMMMMIGLGSTATATAVSSQILVGGLVFPYMVKVALSLSIVRKTYWEAVESGRLFLFQLAHITFDDAPNTRLQRALRLISRRLIISRSPQQDDLITLNTLSFIAL